MLIPILWKLEYDPSPSPDLYLLHHAFIPLSIHALILYSLTLPSFHPLPHLPPTYPTTIIPILTLSHPRDHPPTLSYSQLSLVIIPQKTFFYLVVTQYCNYDVITRARFLKLLNLRFSSHASYSIS